MLENQRQEVIHSEDSDDDDVYMSNDNVDLHRNSKTTTYDEKIRYSSLKAALAYYKNKNSLESID